MHRLDQRLVQLQQRLAAGEDHIGRGASHARAVLRRPERRQVRGERRGIRKAPAVLAVGAEEVGIAEGAGGTRPVRLPAGPEVAAGEAAEDAGATGLSALALQGIEGLLDVVHQAS